MENCLHLLLFNTLSLEESAYAKKWLIMGNDTLLILVIVSMLDPG